MSLCGRLSQYYGDLRKRERDNETIKANGSLVPEQTIRRAHSFGTGILVLA